MSPLKPNPLLRGLQVAKKYQLHNTQGVTSCSINLIGEQKLYKVHVVTTLLW